MSEVIIAVTFIICIVRGVNDLFNQYRAKKVREARRVVNSRNIEKQKARRKREREEQAKQNNLREYYNSDTLGEEELKSLFNISTPEPEGSFYHNDFNEFFSLDEEDEVLEEAVTFKVEGNKPCILDSEDFIEENTYNFRKKHGLLSVEEIIAGKNLPLNQRNTSPIRPKDEECLLPHYTQRPNVQYEEEDDKVIPFKVC